ncbi:hypothetical protein V6N12_061242 [Hibiscus sabdariffa]|uniref:Uncharacterized protein n=1 Tax=Hibiscus sabdariffa TaxID=183260 RepID=A0ABR2DWI1_9ROSI
MHIVQVHPCRLPPEPNRTIGSAIRREHDDGRCNDMFRMIDCKSLLVPPKYVAFKGYNGKYLGPHDNYAAFTADDIGDPNVAWQTVYGPGCRCGCNVAVAAITVVFGTITKLHILFT